MSSDSAIDYEGPLSTYREWHAATFGALVGTLVGWSATLRRDVRHEPHYALGAGLLAALVAFALQGGGDAR